ncbi:MAG: hypothetical protein LBE36_13485 [Flavobacteriaceae bacterium]|jgi:hypothetical protein|nr:hypothetical protein [Flavobacteriaceae bacterium]
MKPKKQIKLSELQDKEKISLILKNGTVITGIFQFIDGDEFDGDIVLSPLSKNKNTPMLGWNISKVAKILKIIEI